MTTIKTIIVPVDYSDGSVNALEHAIEIAVIHHSTLHVVNAYHIPTTGASVMIDISEIWQKSALEELAAFEQKARKLDKADQVNMHFECAQGLVFNVVSQVAEKHHADLVVMGTTGASGFTGKWLGSNTAATARNLEIPLLAIPAKLAYKPYRSVLLATDMKLLSDTKSLEFVAQFTESFQAEMRFLHVDKDGHATPAAQDDAYKAQTRAIFREIPKFIYAFDSDIEATIERTIQSTHTDLLVTIRHNYGFFERIFHSSESQKLINNASLPVLVLKE